jgi:hypothetical protein
MKFIKLAVMAAAALGYSSAYAFHDGGVAYCDGCHTMHNSNGGKAMARKGASTQFQGLSYLLQGSDDSSTCLNCHAAADAPGKPSGYHIMTYPAPAVGTAPTQRTPGGDFAWLTQSYSGKGSRGQTVSTKGERHGHNVVALDYGLVADATLTTAPGGTYAAANLSCASCHDPHARARVVDANGTIAYPALGTAVLPIGKSGSYVGNTVDFTEEALGTYRFLAGSNYSQMSYTVPTAFNADPPVARAPSSYNTSSATAGGVRVAYGKGMSEWCANCHRTIHNDNTNTANTQLIHPAGNLALLTAAANDLQGNATGTTIAAIYNAYKKSGDLTGTSAGSFSSTVPYEAGTGVLATLDALQPTAAGPSTGTENVMCLSCHRAHAGGFNNMGRWNLQGSFLTADNNWAGLDGLTPEQVDYSTGMPMAVYKAAMYDQDATNYAFAQRNLCNKCHAKD